MADLKPSDLISRKKLIHRLKRMTTVMIMGQHYIPLKVVIEKIKTMEGATDA